MRKVKHSKTLIWPLIRLTSLFLGVQIFLIIYSKLEMQYRLTVTFGNELIHTMLLSHSFWLTALRYIFTQLSLYALFILIIWHITKLISEKHPIKNKSYIRLGISLWTLGILYAFVANQYFYPHSTAAFLLKIYPKLGPTINLYLFYVLSIIVMLILLYVLTLYIIKLWQKPIGQVTILLIPIILFGYFLWSVRPPQQPSYAESNIIIIGIDALRPDKLQYMNNDNNYMPFLNHTLKSSTIFTQAYSPLARTYPAWMAILSGQYPKTSGSRFNLQPPNSETMRTLLSKQLQASNYLTLYAASQNRFTPINKNYGFDKTIGPKVGIGDLIIASFNDLIFSNLLMNTPLGKYLFPYTHQNLYASVTYDPYALIHSILREIPNSNHQPIYLAVHLHLTHWPHQWARSQPEANDIKDKHAKAITAYNRTLKTIDEQIQQLIIGLKKKNRLDNAMLIFISDHGFSFGLPQDRVSDFDHYIPGSDTKIKYRAHSNKTKSIGYGGDLISLVQNHVLLAFKLYGKLSNISTKISYPSSLVDINPTILNYLRMPIINKDGISLLPLITGNTDQALQPRPIFMETGLSLSAITKINPDPAQVLAQGIDYYSFDKKNNYITVNSKLMNQTLAAKQKAILNFPWLLIVIPHGAQPNEVILANLKTGQWTLELDSPLARQAPLKNIKQEMQKFYGNEVNGL